MSTTSLHKVQGQILYDLRHAKQLRYSDLMRPTGLESDAFKFHIRELLKKNLIEKTDAGMYRLTTSGSEFANNLDDSNTSNLKQPKLSMLLVVPGPIRNGAETYLFQRRSRNPYWGFYGLLSGPVPWGEQIETASIRELQKQTGFTATFRIASFCRTRDFEDDNGKLLEDKLFAVVVAENVRGDLKADWRWGYNEWMILAEIEHTGQYFPSTLRTIAMVRDGVPYWYEDNTYEPADY